MVEQFEALADLKDALTAVYEKHGWQNVQMLLAEEVAPEFRLVEPEDDRFFIDAEWDRYVV